MRNQPQHLINEWLKPRVPVGCVIHSFRHALRDRVRAVQCPSEMVDQIGGWSSGKIGEGYGDGYHLTLLSISFENTVIPQIST